MVMGKEQARGGGEMGMYRGGDREGRGDGDVGCMGMEGDGKGQGGVEIARGRGEMDGDRRGGEMGRGLGVGWEGGWGCERGWGWGRWEGVEWR